MQVKIEKKSILDVNADVIIVNLFEGVKNPAGVTGIVNKEYKNLISEYVIKKEKFTGKYGEIYKLPLPDKEKIILIALFYNCRLREPKRLHGR